MGGGYGGAEAGDRRLGDDQVFGAYSGLAGPFVIADFAGREVVYVDNALSGDVVEHAPDVATMKRLWESLRVEALPMKQSLELMAKVAETWNSRI